MDLATRYLGLALAHPFMSGASPLADNLDMVVRLEDAGAAAIVLPSLFEEDIVSHDLASDRYLEHLLRVKQRVGVPVIASLNGAASEGWLHYARLLERGGADALELNFYHVATDPAEGAEAVESRVIDIVAVLKESITIPLAVKLSPFFSSLPQLAARSIASAQTAWCCSTVSMSRTSIRRGARRCCGSSCRIPRTAASPAVAGNSVDYL